MWGKICWWNKFKRQKADPQDIDKFILDFIFSGTGPFGELLAPFVNKTIFLETISEITQNKKKTGGKIYSDLAVENGDYEEIFKKSFMHLINTLEPGVVTTTKQLYYGFREKLTGTGQSYYLEDVLLGLGTGMFTLPSAAILLTPKIISSLFTNLKVALGWVKGKYWITLISLMIFPYCI